MTAEKVNSQILNLGQQNTVSLETGGSMVEAAVKAESFQSLRLPRVDQMEQEQFVRRLWEMDGSLWRSDPGEQSAIRESLGWLQVADKIRARASEIDAFVQGVKEAGFTHVVHMGMGGSSLAPFVFQRLFQVRAGGLPLTVLDTTRILSPWPT